MGSRPVRARRRGDLVELLVPVDAKFLLDNFERLADAETDG